MLCSALGTIAQSGRESEDRRMFQRDRIGLDLEAGSVDKRMVVGGEVVGKCILGRARGYAAAA